MVVCTYVRESTKSLLAADGTLIKHSERFTSVSLQQLSSFCFIALGIDGGGVKVECSTAERIGNRRA